MRRSIRGILAGLLTMGSLSIFSLSAALPAHAAQAPSTTTCRYVEVTMEEETPVCAPAAALAGEQFDNVTQICNMDPVTGPIIFDEADQQTSIAPGQCKAFLYQSGTIRPAF